MYGLRYLSNRLWIYLAACFVLLSGGAEVRAQGNCLVIDPEDTGELSGLRCITALTDGLEAEVAWSFTEGDMNRRLIELTLDSAPGQQVQVELISAGEPVVTLNASDGAAVSRTIPLLPAAYTFRFTVTGEEGRFILNTQSVGNSLGIGTSPAGRSNRATRTNGTFARLGSLQGGADYVRWRLDEAQAEHLWRLTATGTPGFPLTVKLFSEDGDPVLQEELASGETLELTDLQLPAGDYTFVLSPESEAPQAGYHLTASPLGPLTDGQKTGRTRSHSGANRVTTATGIRGQLDEDGTDYFHLIVSDTEAGYYSLRADLAPGLASLCIDGAQQQELACYAAADELIIPVLKLDEGEYWLRLNGTRSQNPAYELTFTEVTAPDSDIIVTAPSGTRAAAITLPESLGVRITHPSRTITWLELPLSESGLYRVQVQGDGNIRTLTVTDGGGGRIRNESNSNRLDNVPLRLGSNFIGLDAEAGEYALRVLHLGPLPTEEPQPAQAAVEVAADEATGEPALIEARPAGTVVPAVNHRAVDAVRLSAGRDYVGTIDGPDAYYRFSLRNDARVQLTLTPPDDGEMRLRLTPAVSGDRTTSEPGEQLTLNHWLPAGDYRVELRMNNDSTGWYALRLELFDPLDLPLDADPLDASNARPIPADHVLRVPGRTDGSMTYRLPFLQDDTQLDIHVSSGDLRQVWVTRAPGAAARDRLQPLAEDRDSGVITFGLEAGVEYLLSLRSGSTEEWDLRLDFGDTLPARDVPDLQEELTLTLDYATDEVAAWSRYGQTLNATFTAENGTAGALNLSVLNHTSDPRVAISGLPEQLHLAVGETAELALELLLPADLRSDAPLTVTVGLRDESGAVATAAADLLPSCDAPHSGAHVWWPAPLAERIYWNYARSALGASISGFPSSTRDVQLIDGRVSPATPSTSQGKYYVLDLVQPRTVHATMLHPLANGDALEGLRDFRISASDDGENWETVLEASMSSALIEQFFGFPEPVTARFLRLDPLSNQARDGRGMNIGEWKLLGTDMPFGRINLADATLGGHLVQSNLLQSMDRGMLEDGANQPQARSTADGRLDWVLGFHDNHAAQITGLEWQEYELRNNNSYIPAVRVSVSTESPLGPWEHLTDWRLPQTTDLAQLTFDEPVWARFIRFEVQLDLEEPGRVNLNLPTSLRVFEHQGDGYRSILSEWGMGSQHASYEHTHPELVELVNVSFGDNGEPATAHFLADESNGFVQTGRFEAWYDFEVNEEAAHVTMRIDSGASFALDWQVFDAEDQLVDEGSSDRALRRTLPPGSYRLRIAEPPRSIAFIWDNSGSVSPFSAMIYAALERFATGITRGQEEVMLGVFSTGGANFLLPDWSGDADEVSLALNDYDRSDAASDSPNALLAINPLLVDRRGSRSILLITDAETGFNSTPNMWRSFVRPEPQVFALHVSTASSDYSEDFMQDVSAAYGGHYTLARTAGDLEVGLLRADCLIRRPKPYHVSIAFEDRQPEPGTLAVQSPSSREGGGSGPTGGGSGAIEVILDASGSMWQTLDGRYRYDIANEVLIDLVNNVLPEEVPFALRVFGNREADVCRSDLEVSLAPLDPGAVSAVIAGIEPQPFAGTPLAESIQLAAQDLAGASGSRTLILITDGEESCDGDVEAAITELRSAGVDVVLNIIGFDFDATDPAAARERFREWASLGGGQYFDASDAAELADALEQSVAVGYEVVDGEGNVVSRGTVDGPAVEVPGGTFTVRVIGESGIVIEGVHIDGGEVEVAMPD